MEISEFRAHLRIIHPSKAAREIVDGMPIPASIVHSVGEPCKTPKGALLKGTYSRTYVTFDLNAKAYTSIPVFLEDMLAKPFASAAIIKDIVEFGGQARLYISIFCAENSGFSLEASLLAKLAKKHMTLDLDIYPERKFKPRKKALAHRKKTAQRTKNS
jgi:hypothetical protein